MGNFFYFFFLVFGILILSLLTLSGLFAVYTGIVDFIHARAEFLECLLQLIGGIFLTSIGGIPLILLFRARYEKIKFKRLMKLYPDKPWMFFIQWAKGRIPYSAKGSARLLWISVFGYHAFLGLLVAFRWNDIWSHLKNSPFLAIPSSLIFPFGSMISLYIAIRKTIQWKKFGTSTFVMSSIPGVIGGKLEGTVQTRLKEIPKKGFSIVLSCVLLRRIEKQYYDKGSKKTRTEIRQEVLWQDEQKVPRDKVEIGLGGISIPVSFSIPSDSEESDLFWREDQKIEWYLSVSAKLPGVDYEGEFEVPVFRTKREESKIDSL